MYPITSPLHARVDPWKISILLKAKKFISAAAGEEGGGEEEEEEFPDIS